jgi:transposase-like protein
MKLIVQAGAVCQNPDCSHFLLADGSHVVHYGKTKQGVQRFKCGHCQKCFCQRKGTLLYRKRTPETVILSSLSSIAKGGRLSTVSEATGKKSDTIAQWVKEAGTHAEGISDALLHDYQLSASEVDGLWSYVKNKGEKK